MSGGHYDYKCHEITNFADSVLADCTSRITDHPDSYGFTVEALPKDIIDSMQKFAENLKKFGDMAYAIEWYMSGDTSDDTIRAQFKKFIEETNNKTTVEKCNENEFIIMPKSINIFNASNERCDFANGPCSCGAWHDLKDWPKEILKKVILEMKNNEEKKD